MIQALGLKYHKSWPCYLDRGWWSLFFAARGHGPGVSIHDCRWAYAHKLKRYSSISPALIYRTEVLSFTWRAPFGVCGLLALPNIHQIFGDNSAEFPRFTRDEACVFSSWRLHAAEVLATATSGIARCGPAFGELSGGNWISRLRYNRLWL
jgi:hypothetical protein